MSASVIAREKLDEAVAWAQASPAGEVRWITWSICGMAALAVGWATLAQVDVVASAPGRVIPPGKSKVVQPLEPGVVRSIAVRDGQAVKQGQLLLELDTTSAQADRVRLLRDLQEAQADVQRAQAMLGLRSVSSGEDLPIEIRDNKERLLESRLTEQRSRLAGLDADLARRMAEQEAASASLIQLRSSLPLVRQKHQMRDEMSASGHMARTAVLESQLELNQMEREAVVQEGRLREATASIKALTEQRRQMQAEFRSRASLELTDATKRRDAARQELVKATQRADLQVLRSPIDGVVQQLAVSTIGGVVTQAQPLMVVVPHEATLEVEAQVLNRDIGHVRPGQRVVNKVETFDFTRFGYIEGTVYWVGTDSIVDPKLGPVYPVRIRLQDQRTPRAVNGMRGVINPGMSVNADIRVGERRLIEYFLSPFLRYRQEALRER